MHPKSARLWGRLRRRTYVACVDHFRLIRFKLKNWLTPTRGNLKLLLVIALIFPASACFAESDCPQSIFFTIGKFLKIQSISRPNQQDSLVVTAACKVWPYDPKLTIVAIAFKSLAEKVHPGKETLIALVDTRRNTVAYSTRAYVEEDAVDEFGDSSYSIDTARYQLTDTQRAFGIRFNTVARGPSCADAGSDTVLTLYVPSGSSLKPG